MVANSKGRISLQNIRGLRDRAVLWDTEVKGFAARTLPTVQEHLQLAQSVNDAVKSTKS